MTVPGSTDLFEAFPDVLVDHDNKYFFAGLLNRELILNRCRDCGDWHAEPFRACCPACWSWNIEHRKVSGRGRVYTLTRLHQGPDIDGVSYTPPLPLAVIELAEQPGLRVVAGLVGRVTDENSIGRDVQLVWPEDSVAPRLTFEVMEYANEP